MTRINKRNKRIKILRNRCLFFICIILTFTISFKTYNYFYASKIKNNKVISATELTRDKTYKAEPLKENNKNDNVEDTNVIKNNDTNNNKDTSSDNKKNDDRKNVSSIGKEYTYDAQKVKDILDNKFQSDGEKIAFLTFDDGPSTSVTPQILNILKNYDVKATFFLVGQNIEASEKSKELVKQIFEEGHAIGNHTYSHNMRKLYPGNTLDVSYLMGEVEQTDTDIRNIVGQDFNTRILRLPGGYMSRVYYNDPNLNELNERLKEKNMYSIDWNAYDFDAEGRWKNSEELLQHVKESVGTQEKVIILMHDTYGKEETARALPQIIEYLKSEGYAFKTIA